MVWFEGPRVGRVCCALLRGESGLLNAAPHWQNDCCLLGPLMRTRRTWTGLSTLITPCALWRAILKSIACHPEGLVALAFRSARVTPFSAAPGSAPSPAVVITTPEACAAAGTQTRYAFAAHTTSRECTSSSSKAVSVELAIARLRTIAAQHGHPLRIWGLSATLPDLPQALHTLLGPGREGRLIRAPQPKRYLIDAILPPSLERFPWSGHLGLQLLPQVIERIDQSRSTLLFTNTRSQAELWYQPSSRRARMVTVTGSTGRSTRNPRKVRMALRKVGCAAWYARQRDWVGFSTGG